jgi:hypothetical protein
MDKLKAADVAAFRLKVWNEQGQRCAITGQKLAFKDAVLDHDHKTGECRGVLARGANSMLGKIENHRKLAQLTSDADLHRMLIGVVKYLNLGRLGVRYPTHRDDDEKRVRRNKLAAKRRTKKATTE